MRRVSGPLELLATNLPDFSNPPVVEVAIAVEFSPLPNLDILTLVALHESWSDELPGIELQPPIAPSVASAFPVEFIAGVPPLRLWSLSQDGDLLLQVQNDRLIVNWRRQSAGGDAYPHYPQLADAWSARWSQFLEFLSGRGISAPRSSVAEVSYVNNVILPAGVTPAEAITIFGEPAQAWPVALTQARQVYDVSPEPFRGHTSVQAELSDSQVGELNLTVVTRLEGEDRVEERGLRTMLDAAHVLSVQAFVAATSRTMHRHWGIKA